MLLSLLLVPLLIWRFLRFVATRRQRVAQWGSMGLAQNPTGQGARRRRYGVPLFFLLGTTFLLLGLARPELELALPRIEGTVILAFDLSSSMTAADLEPTRLEAAKAAARAFVEAQPLTIRIGVVAFGNGGVIVQPPTSDQAAVLTAIERLTPQGGTSLGQGIFASLNAIAGTPLAVDEAALAADALAVEIGSFPSAVILLLSDGENTAPPDPLTVAQLAANAGVRLFTVGIGSKEGAVIEVEGFRVLTQLNEGALQELAALTNGDYYYAADAAALQAIYETIDLQLTVKGERIEVTAILATIGFFFFLAGGALSMFWLGRVP